MTRILVVDDDRALSRALAINLRARRFDVETAFDGAAALRRAASFSPDIVILDLGLPDMDGVEVVAGLRGWSDVPIVVLSARGTQSAKVDALDAGADDYITKPFGMDELLARIRAALRRATHDAPAPVVRTADFTVDLAAKKVIRDGSPVRLTPTEWSVLELLVRNTGTLVSRQQMLKEVWGPTYGGETNYLRVYLAQLRRKLEPVPARPRYLITEPGIGYRFEAESGSRTGGTRATD